MSELKSNVVDESMSIGSSAPISSPIVERPENEKAKEQKEKRQKIIASLAPAVEIFSDLIDEEVEREDSLRLHLSSAYVDNPTEFLIECRSSAKYADKITKFKRLLQQAASEVEHDS